MKKIEVFFKDGESLTVENVSNIHLGVEGVAVAINIVKACGKTVLVNWDSVKYYITTDEN